MKQTAQSCLASLALALVAWSTGTPLTAAASNTQTQTQTHAGHRTHGDPLPARGPAQARPPVLALARAEEPATPATTSTSTTTTPAKPRAGKRETYPFRGKVAAVDVSAKTVTLEGRAARRIIAVTTDTRLERNGASATLEAFQPGEAVGGTLRKTPDGLEQAVLIRFGPKAEAGASRGAKRPAPGSAEPDTDADEPHAAASGAAAGSP